MPGNTYRTGLAIVGLLAGIALIVRGLLDLRDSQGWALILIGIALLAAVALRRFVYRD